MRTGARPPRAPGVNRALEIRCTRFLVLVVALQGLVTAPILAVTPALAGPASASPALAASASAAPANPGGPRTSLADVEDEVMCPICGTLLELSESPQAKRQRVFVDRLIAEGRTKEQIKEALVEQYGPQVLALPEGSGFNLSAYLVPAIAFLVAAAALAVGVTRWRRNARPPQSKTPPAAPPEGDAAERLDADIARYDL